MQEEDYKYWEQLPSSVVLYRGVMEGRNPDGISYTDDYDKALWFANRWNTKDKYIIKVNADKSDCLCYFNTRNEKEIVLNSIKYKNRREILVL